MTYSEYDIRARGSVHRRGRGLPTAAVLLALGALIGCAGHVHEQALTNSGALSVPQTMAAQPESLATQSEPREAGEVAAARAYLDEARLLLEEGEQAQLRGEYTTTEYYLKEAQQVLLEVDVLLPTRTRLESERPATEDLAVMHEATLSLRLEFERLWTRSNALYDQLLPDLDLLDSASGLFQGEETMDLEAMNAALETMVDPAPGSWQDIRDLLLKMEADGEIGLDMEFEGYPESAWKQVYWSVQYYTGRGRRNFSVWLERSGRYRGLVERILEEESLPRDMVFLCMIESGFSPRAYSRVAATGPWQFMYYTAPKFGLKTYRSDTYIDERRDYEKSTRAATA